MKVNKKIKKLEDKKWKEFKIGDLFNVSGTLTTHPSNLEIGGKTPRITCSSSQNGLDNVYLNKATERGKVLTVDSAAVGYISYQEKDFIATDHVEKIESKLKPINRNTGLSLVTCMTKAILNKFNYGYKFSQTRIKKQLIMLPINQNLEPDYEYMEQYTNSITETKLIKYKSYVKKQLEKIEFKEVEKLEDKKWKEFFIEKLFNVRIGKNVDGNKINKQGGKIPYVTRKESRNGIDGFISYNQDFLTVDYPVITIGNETAEPFIQKYPFFTGTKVNILKPKQKVSEYTLKFIATSLKAHKSKYSYSFTINSTRLKRQKIMLPVNQNLEPDYEYMEQYIKNITYKKLSNYLNYKKLL
jgi:hypothetical protein